MNAKSPKKPRKNAKKEEKEKNQKLITTKKKISKKNGEKCTSKRGNVGS